MLCIILGNLIASAPAGVLSITKFLIEAAAPKSLCTFTAACKRLTPRHSKLFNLKKIHDVRRGIDPMFAACHSDFLNQQAMHKTIAWTHYAYICKDGKQTLAIDHMRSWCVLIQPSSVVLHCPRTVAHLHNAIPSSNPSLVPCTTVTSFESGQHIYKSPFIHPCQLPKCNLIECFLQPGLLTLLAVALPWSWQL